MILKMMLIVFGIFLLILDLFMYARQKLTDGIGLGWAIESLLMCKTCVMSVYENSEYCGCMLAYDNEINEKFLETEIRRFHYEKFNTENFENGYVELVYTDADKERCIYFKANCVYL